MITPLRAAALVVLVSLAAPVLAQDEAPTDDRVVVTEKDYTIYQKLRFAETLASARRMYARGNAEKIKRIEAEPQKELEAAGWTAERLSNVGTVLGDVISNLKLVEAGGEDAQAGKENLEAAHPTTVATAKAHRKELENPDPHREAAEKQAKDEDEAERNGTPPDAKTLPGTWVLDKEASLKAASAQIPAGPERDDLVKKLEAVLKPTTYVFGPGNAIESRVTENDGKVKVEKGTYRLDGRKIVMKSEGSKSEHSLDAGMKNGDLCVGKFGMTSMVFKKQK